MKKSSIKTAEHAVKRLFFAAASPLLRKGRSDFRLIDPHHIKRILFIRPEKLGDMIISLPVFYNLKKLHPHLELYLLSSPRNCAVIEHDVGISRNFLYT